MLRKLLVPLDGSELAEAVLPWSLFLAREKHLALTLARVVRIPTNGRNNGAGQSEPGSDTPHALRQSATSYLENVRGRLAQEGVTVDVTVREGAPARVLLDLADEIDASAIVLATSGLGAPPHHALSGVVDRIIQEATLPLLLIPATARLKPPALKQLLVPLDGSPLAERALDSVRELTSEGASVELVQAVEPMHLTLDTAEGRLPLEDVETTRAAVSDATSYLHGVQQSISSDSLAVSTSVPLGTPEQQILATAHRQATDLIVMVTHGATGSAGGWLGSVANNVVRQTDVPVFLVSARALMARVARGQRVGDAMTVDPLIVRADESLSLVLRRMLRRRASAAPVIDANGSLVGVISEEDLLRWQLKSTEGGAGTTSTRSALAPQSLRATRAAEIMSLPSACVEESLPLMSAVPTLLESPHRHLPVTRQGRLVGVLSSADILRAMADRETAADERPASEWEAAL